MALVSPRSLLPAFALALFAAAPAARGQVTVDFPLKVGLSVPTYDRVNGLSLPFGPSITVGDWGDERLVVEPRLTYRSNLGDVDPGLYLKARLGHDTTFNLILTGSRGTFSNEDWIRSDVTNSAVSLVFGQDSRNYFRADRAEVRFTAALPVSAETAQLFIGARTENAWSTGWRMDERRGPFSIFATHDQSNGIDRPNPEIDQGHLTSVLGGGMLEYRSGLSTLKANALLEVAADTPLNDNFQQLTIDEQGSLYTVAGQRLEVDGHLVATTGGTTPWQRYAYLGGSGTLTTLDLLSLGGDHLYFVDARYVIPIPALELPLLGRAFVAPRVAAGAAGVDGFGRTVTNVGLRVGAGFLAIDLMVNHGTHQTGQGIGISIAR